MIRWLSNHWNKASFRIPAFTAIFSMLTGLIAGGIAFYIAYLGFLDLAKNRVELVRTERARVIERALRGTANHLSSVVAAPRVKDALKDFSRALISLPEAERRALIERYTKSSPFASGTRSALLSADDGTEYTNLHKNLHQVYVYFAELEQLEDIVFIDSSGTVVYSVTKGEEFGSNLLSEGNRESYLARIFQSAFGAASRERIAFTDAELSSGSNRPELFMGQVVYDDASGEKLGVAVYQLSLERLAALANDTENLGTTGEVYLVGPDLTRRSGSRFFDVQLLVDRVDTDPTRNARDGLSGTIETVDYRGVPVISSFAPINLLGLQWGIISEIDRAEALAPLDTLLFATAVGVLASTITIALIGFGAARRIGKPLSHSLRIMERLGHGDLRVEIPESTGLEESRQISSALKIFHGNLIETERLISEGKQNQRQLESLLDSSPTGIIVVSVNSEVLYVNDPGALILGKRKAELIGENFSFSDVAIEENFAERMIAAVKRDGVLREIQAAGRTADGKEFTLRLSSRETTFKGQTAYLSWFEDITDSLRAETELRESQQLLRGVIENSSSICFAKDRNGKYLLVNRVWEDVIGRKRDEVMGKTDLEIHADLDVARQLMSNDQEVMKARKPVQFEEVVPRRGEPRTYLAIKFPLFDGDGHVTGICGMSTDITDRIVAERAVYDAKEAAERSRKALDEQVRLIQEILDALPIAIAYRDADTRYIGVNRKFENTFGVSRSEIVGKRLIETTFIPEDERQHMQKLNDEMMRTGDALRLERKVKLADDRDHFMLYHAHTYGGSAGKPAGAVGAFVDITEIKELQEAIAEAMARAEAATHAKSDFLASMSHELRTPMNGVTGMADLLAQTKLNDEQRHMVRTIRESGNALITVINDILDLSKIEAGKLDLENVTMSLASTVEGVASTLMPNAVKMGVSIHVYIDPSLPAKVHGDPTRIRQILFNLGGNAIKFSNGNDIEIRVTPVGSADDERTRVRFSVIDKGIGISAEDQKKLFQAFSQAESSTTRRFGGTGLGLAICKRLVEMMGGVIDLESRERVGSTFWVELPFLTADAGPSSVERELEGLRILLVGSEGPRHEAIGSYIGHAGGEIIAVKDADDAAPLPNRKKPALNADIVLIDMGLDLTRQKAGISKIRKSFGRKVPIIVFHGHHHNGDTQITAKGIFSVDVAPLIRLRLISAIAVAAGRISPEIKYEIEEADFKPATAPTVEEALERGRLLLLAEDNPTNQDVIRRQLGTLGYACEVAEDGVKALEAYKRGRYALLLTDCHMPNMDGYELAQKIRALERSGGRRMPIIAITASALLSEAQKCFAAGMDDYLSKPVALNKLRDTVKKWLQDSVDAQAGGAGPNHPAAPPLAGLAVAAGQSPIDPSVIRAIVGDDDVAIQEVMTGFPGPARKILGEMERAFSSKDAGETRGSAHKLKSAARTIGALTLGELCEAVETAGTKGNWSELELLIPKVQAELSAVTSYINKARG